MWVKSIILSNFPPTVRIFLAYIETNPLGHLLGKERESNHEKYFCVFFKYQNKTCSFHQKKSSVIFFTGSKIYF